jgi:hypothetical protein
VHNRCTLQLEHVTDEIAKPLPGVYENSACIIRASSMQVSNKVFKKKDLMSVDHTWSVFQQSHKITTSSCDINYNTSLQFCLLAAKCL